MSATDSYRAARDQLLAMRGQYERAATEFRWPELGDRFNWAVACRSPMPHKMCLCPG
jgi:acetyl-CoA synthetase